MKMSCQLNGDDMDAICGIAGVFFWKTSHTVSQKTSSTVAVLFASSYYEKAEHKINHTLHLVKVPVQKRGKKMNPNQIMQGYSHMVKKIFKMQTASNLKHLGCT